MNLTLGIDTTGLSSHASILDCNGRELALGSLKRERTAEGLALMLAQVCRDAGVSLMAVKHIALSLGPGSFTGIRSGIASAQGIAMASGAKLSGVSLFVARSIAALQKAHANTVICYLSASKTDFYVAALRASSPADAACPLKCRYYISDVEIVFSDGLESRLHELAVGDGDAVKLNLDSPEDCLREVDGESNTSKTETYRSWASLPARAVQLGIGGYFYEKSAEISLDKAVSPVDHFQEFSSSAALQPVYIKGANAKSLQERRAEGKL